MKNLIRAGICITGLCFMSPSFAGGDYMQGWGFLPESNVYLGGSVGAANQSDFDDGTSAAGKVFGGVRYRYIGAELGYTKLGEVEGTFVPEGARLEETVKSDTGGLYAAAMGYLPVYTGTDIFGKLGAMYWDNKNETETEMVNISDESDDSGISPMAGIGAQYQLTPNLFLRGEWEHIFGTGDDKYETDVDLLSLGMSLSTY